MIEVFSYNHDFIDERGSITNLVESPVGVALIKSYDGAVRGNHSHPHGHTEIVLRGEVVVSRLDPYGNKETATVSSGQGVYTPPGGVPHAFKSVGDSLMIHVLDVPYEKGKHDASTKKVEVI